MTDSSAKTSIHKGSRFALRVYPARAVALGLGFFSVAAVFYELKYDFWLWFTLIMYCYAWPHIAHLYASQVSDSFRTGVRQLMVDSFFGGIWISAMLFNLLPSVLILTMLSMNNISSGGFRLFGAGLIAQLVGTIIGVAIFGWNPQLESSLAVIIASSPFLATHPLIVGLLAYNFATRLHEQRNSLKLLSRTDGLTGLYNRRYWQLRAAEEFDRSLRNERPAVLIMLDIDHFKRINDQHGHSVGDEVLRDISHILQTHLRSIDILGRYGGEEFAVVLPDMNFTNAHDMAERLRKAVENARFGSNGQLKCTISLGVSQLHPSIVSIEDWINSADEVLYNAKSQGRNRTCLAG